MSKTRTQAKKIERLLNDNDIYVDGYEVIDDIESDYTEKFVSDHVVEIGDEEWIAYDNNFETEFTTKGGINLIFGCSIQRDYDYSEESIDGTTTHYPNVDFCRFEKNGETKEIELDVYLD